ncbi:dTMP kinase [Hahella sp. CCB-MM4]|uniref:dTMP kinase n=1 Tax=Hahella sp. (strain CCB-MM4) TaxID=1926491 RepID=UPI000B9A2FDC|nr:dTMP kinase [Hahella sp. CCB-MM4]OZG71296.1 dTMP kinase [Hahella sp. CCB-MM4]
MNRGLFITVEGIEGAGKTTNLEFVRSVLQEQGMNVVTTREPGGTPLAEEIREMLLAPREEQVSAKAELLMMFAARAQHLEQKVMPLIKSGVHVLSDRFTDATYAYQGGGRGLSWDLIQRLENIVQEEFRPDLTLLLCVNPEVGIARARKRGALDRFEQEKLEFYIRVQDAYMKRVAESPERFCVINAQEPLEVIQPQIRQALLTKLSN